MNYLILIFLAAVTCSPLAIHAQQAEKEVKPRREQENKQVVREWVSAINAHNVDRLAATLNENFIWELGESSTTGRDVSKQAWSLWFVAFPDLHFEVVQTITEGDYVVSRLIMKGTHKGELRFRGTESMSQPIPPTNRKFSVPGCAVHQVRSGQIVRLWAYWDTSTMLRQLGVSPRTSP
jgi:steroid delta-isomerase-like uncharacterized protein